MTVAAAYLGEPWRLPIQLGALYCLFTIYMYQIEEPKIKVIIVIKISILKNLIFFLKDSINY